MDAKIINTTSTSTTTPTTTNNKTYDMIPGSAQYKNGCLFSQYSSGLFVV